jgi:signal peptidase I
MLSPVPGSGDFSCVSRTEERLVRGASLAGVIENEAAIKIAFGYYDCNEVARGDVVAYFYAGSEEPLVKIVKAVPGDTFELRSDGDVWRIVVNGQVLRTSAGEPYAVTVDRYRRFQLYERDYGKSLPAGTYMILSNTAGDSADSRAFGLVDKSDILGKVVY